MQMDFTSLGRLSSQASVLGLGTGGFSRLGQGYGLREEDSVALVQAALARGVNLVDTAQGYGTEGIVGQALRAIGTDIPREQLLICSKAPCHTDMQPRTMAEFTASVEGSLTRMGLDYLDLYYVHGLYADHVDHALRVILPGLQELKAQGLIRAAGVSEHFNTDPAHHTLHRLLTEAPELLDVLMIGFNILNQSARHEVLPLCQQHGIGVTCMFAVRHAFSQPAVLARIVGELVAQGRIEADAVNPAAPLDFVLAGGHATSLTEAAYRYCRYEPGIDVVLSGTGKLAHLETNIASLLLPPLPAEIKKRIDRIFARVDSVSGQDRPFGKK